MSCWGWTLLRFCPVSMLMLLKLRLGCSMAPTCCTAFCYLGCENHQLVNGPANFLLVESVFCPYRLWTFARHMEATSASRKMFCERASDEKRGEIAAELIKLQERSELLQEARLDFGAEKWGLKSSGCLSSSANASRCRVGRIARR